MFQSFTAASDPTKGPERLKRLRKEIKSNNLDGFLIPREDAFRGENVAACDERLSWLTGFTGSAGFAAVLANSAGVFIDGRYRVAVKSQVDLDHFTPVHWPETHLADWLKDTADAGQRIGFDPWLHSVAAIDALNEKLDGSGITMVPTDNLVDAIWNDRPAQPMGRVEPYPIELSGQSSPDKRAEIAAILRNKQQSATVLTVLDSIAWLLNIRGSDIARMPAVRCFAIVHETGHVDLFVEQEKVDHLGPDPDITIHAPDQFERVLSDLSGTVRIDKTSAPKAVEISLKNADIVFESDPCDLPKACKNAVEIKGARDAHLRDAVAMAQFLTWLDATELGTLTEIDIVTKLESCRADTGALCDISFDTICGAGPNGAIVHYRVTEATNRTLQPNDILLVDSGGQYKDGTTDITRTVIMGTPTDLQRDCFTRVLKGMIAISRARFPKGVTGRDLDVLARTPLWQVGQDYDHGTGHGVGSYLGVHEGPQSIARSPRGAVELKQGMILSNEPGYYREGEFGIRIENLIVVQTANKVKDTDDRKMFNFETLTYTPIDQRLIDVDLLTKEERIWLNDYHAACWQKLHLLVDDTVKAWLKQATQPV